MKKKRILFYYQANKWSNSLVTMLTQLKNKGYEIIVLTICEKGKLHEDLEKRGIKCFSYSIKKNNSILFYLKHIIFLTKFSYQHKIDYIHSHIQQTNFIACIANLFTKSKLLVFRHHFQPVHLFPTLKRNKNEILFDKIINLLAPKIIIPSYGVYQGILTTEKVNPKKLSVIPYIYNFSLYDKPDNEKVTQIKKQYKSKLLIIMVSRLIKLKQHHVVFPVIKKLKEEGLDIKMLVLSEGPEKENLEKWIKENHMSEHIIMLGFREDFINLMAAADLLIQPSLTDASNSVVKEMALLNKIVAVSKNVGDYSEYIINEQNGFLISLNNPAKDVEKIVKKVYHHKDKYKKLGENLKKDVLKKFDIKNSDYVIEKYIKLMSDE